MNALNFFLLGCGITGTILIFGASKTLLDSRQAQSWEATPVQITSVSLERLPQSDENQQYFRLHANYHYQFNGEQYSANRVGISRFYGLDTREATQRALFDELELARSSGQPIVAYVNPENPASAVLVRDLHYPILLALLAGGLFAAGTGWMTLAAQALARDAPSRPAGRRPSPAPGLPALSASPFRQPTYTPVLFLLIANLVVIAVTLRQGWPLEHLLLIYWVQSVAIWLSNDVRILLMPSTKLAWVLQVQVGNRIIEDPTRKRIIGIMGSWLLFGGFHLIHLVGIVMLFDISWLPDQAFWIAVIALLAAQALSLLEALRIDRQPGAIESLGYGSIFGRIMVIHIIIVFGAWASESTTAVLFFLILKTGADVFLQLRSQR